LPDETYNYLMRIISFLSIILLSITVSSCIPVEAPGLLSSTDPTPVLTATPLPPTDTPVPAFTSTLTPIPTDTPTPTLTDTPTPADTATPAATPTPVVLRGTVLEHSNCRYGPGAVFLYKYGILPTSYMEIIGRDEAGTWLLIRAIGGDNPCWLKAVLMDVKGDVMTVPQVDPDIILPWSPYYPNPLTGVSATRNGSDVTVFWDELITKAGDEIKLEASQMMYVIEAWVCKNGKITFTVIGSNTTAAKISDEPGCTEPSHARVYGADKHGYTPWVEIPWPK
jgi:hypothetical protein